jgi:TonB-dependent receptor
MTRRKNLMVTCAAIAAVLASAPALAQTTLDAGAGANDNTVVVVTGLRKSLQSAADIKKNSAQVVDSIVAEDIGKLPDTNIAETLQRIPGVQITRNTRGEGNAYVVHGLKQVMTTINGRALFTVANRSATLLDFSADLLSGVDVYKTAMADQIEGGLGGLIDVHAARPFDYKGLHMAGTIAGNYSTIHNAITPRMSGVVSDRWQTSHGEFGALLGFQYEQIDSGGYQTGTNSYGTNNNFFDFNGDGHLNSTGNADLVQLPTQYKAQYERGERVRGALYSSLQWRPNADLTLYTDLLWSYSGGHSSTKVLLVKPDASTTAGAGWSFKPGSNIPAVAVYNNALIQTQQGFSDNPYNNYNVAVGGKWHHGQLTTSGELNFERSAGPFYSRSITLQTRAPQVTVNLNGDTPDIKIAGVDPANIANYSYAAYSDLGQRTDGKETSVKFDVRYDLDSGPFTAILAGVKYSDHTAFNKVYSVGFTPSNSGIGLPLSQVTELTPNNLFDGSDSSLNQWVTLKRDILSSMKGTRALIGITTDDQNYPLNNVYNYREKITAEYVEAQFAFDMGVPIDGNIGVRNVKTDGTNAVYQPVATGTAGAVVDKDGKSYTPITGGKPYNNVLPSVNVRAKFTDDLFLRLAYSKAISRPEFGNLSPALVLAATGNTGSGGNPSLQAIKADQYDMSLEHYFGRSNYMAASLFDKKVTGFIQSFAVAEQINGTTYQISRPRNAGTGDISGYELSYQQFFDFLPGMWSGLGLQANYTRVDSKLSVLNQTYLVPAEQLSKNSYNLTGIYEKGPISMHLSYNWRSKYLNTTSGDSFNRPVMVAPLESLDFSATYTINKRMSVKFDAVNMTKAYQHQYYGPSPLTGNTVNVTGDYAAPLLPALANQLDHSFEIGFHYNY